MTDSSSATTTVDNWLASGGPTYVAVLDRLVKAGLLQDDYVTVSYSPAADSMSFACSDAADLDRAVAIATVG